jgi:tRNA 2-thiouridine synthesizing protein D
MSNKTTLTFALMDAPFESARTTTAMRLIDIAVRRGYDVNVFAYEGAVFLPFSKQAAHPNAVHGHDVDEENHPLPKDWIGALMREAERNDAKLDWVNCGLCVDERGAMDAIDGVRRGTPADLLQLADTSTNSLVIATH